MLFVLLALIALSFGAHITTEVYCTDDGDCAADSELFPAFKTFNVELGTCYHHCSPCSVSPLCISEMFTELGDGSILQTLYTPSTDPATPAECTGDTTGSANFTCGACQDATSRGLPATQLTVRYSCKILNPTEIADALANLDPVDVTNAYNGFAVAVEGTPEIGQPAVYETYTTIVVRIGFAVALDAEQTLAAEAIAKDSIATLTGQDPAFITVQFFFAGESVPTRRRDVADVQAFLYDAVITISGAAQMAASALLSLVFLALFI